MDRSDPYQERAREMAREAGLDPDGRIERPGQRSMPGWCTFRDAARKEHLAREAADAASTIAVEKTQAPQFQNSPLKVFGEHDHATVAQMRNCMSVGNVVAGVVCADGHLGYAQPVGGVIAYEKQISISGVGFDIGCGNMAIRLDTPFNAVEDRVGKIIKDVSRTISFGVGRTNEEQVDHELFDDAEAWAASDMESYRQKAAAQLGTVGSGNHYVDLLRDEDGFVWIGVHFGSRGLGHTSATRYLKAAGGQSGINVPPALIDEDSELGRRYIAAMELAGRYAYAGREWVVERVRRIVGGAVTDTVHNHHNYAARDPRGARCMGGAQGRDAGVPRSAWLCRRFDGRRRHDHRRHREPAGARLALLDRPWCRPAVRAQGSQATFHPRANGPVVARPRRDADRRRPGRKPDGLPPPARSDRATRRDGEGAAHPAAVCSGDGGDARARSLEGLAREQFLLSFASAESLSKSVI